MDYNDFKEKNSKEAEAKKPAKVLPNSARWWLANDDILPSTIMGHVGQIIQSDKGRIDSYNNFAKLYGTFTPAFWNGYALSNTGKPTGPAKAKLTYNIVQSCIDTVVAMVTQNKPKPMFLTSAGDSKAQQKAKKLDAYCYGLFYHNEIYKLAPKVFRDSCIFGEGIVHVYPDNGQVKFERVMPYEILVDYLESHYGPESTKSLHRIKNIDRTELANLFPKHAELIAKMAGTAHFISGSARSVADTVTVVESWRLPTGEAPGLHTISTADALLLKEDYEQEFFPFAMMRFSSRLYGFYSQGMAEQLDPIQFEINRTLMSIQRSLHLGGTHKIFVKNGSKVIKSHFDNMVGTILEYAGDTPPQYVVPQLVQPEIYNHLNNMIGLGYQLPGVSQMQAVGVKSPGVDSGRAMRTEQNINSQRQTTLTQSYENFFVDLSKIAVCTAKKLYDQGKHDQPIRIPGKRFIETIKWKDVDLEEDEYVLQIYPVSKLPNDPEGRLATIQEMMQAGLIDSQTGRRLLDYPDLEAEENLANSTRDYLHKILDKIVESGTYTAPETDDNLQVAKQMVLEYIAKGKLDELSEARMDMLRTFNVQVDDLLAAANPPMPVPQGPQAPGATPQASPMAPPTSDLIPNVNI